MSSARLGSTIAGYRLDELLGRGGMSEVYLAEHLHLGRKVALKLLSPALADDMSFRDRFERESRRAADVDHPNIIPIYDAGQATNGELYIAMRYVKGSDLKHIVVRDGPLSFGRALFILEQAAGALDAAHDRDLIHRDVKPANILVEEPSERVYVTDFGIVKHALSRGQTKTGFFVGTADYAAPEQIEGRQVDARTDVYALGCVLYECLAGKPPFDRDAEVAVMHAHLAMPPPQLTAVRPDLPKALDRVIARAMAKAKEERPASCLELIDAARAAVLDQPSRASNEARDALILSDAAAAATRAAAPETRLDDPAAPPPPPSPEPVAAAESRPAAPPPAAPPPVAAHAAGAGRPRGSNTRMWLLVALVAAIAAAGAVVAVVLASGGSDSNSEPSASPPPAATEPAVTPATTEPAATEEPAATTEEPPAVTEAATTLETIVPAALWKNCAIANTPREGATETGQCLPPESRDGFFPDQLEVSIFPDAAAVSAAYEKIEQNENLTVDSGRCTGVSWRGEGTWNHAPDKPGGRRLCYFDGNDAVLVWTHEKLDQPDHYDFLAVARQGGTDHAGLFSWWRFWTHRIGKVVPS